MAYSHDDVVRAQAQNLANARAQALVDYEFGRTSEDGAATMDAAERIVSIDAQTAALERIANNLVMQQSQPQGSRWGLSSAETEIARGLSSGDSKLSNDDRERIYAENKQKLRYQRATGAYRDDQGTVRR